MSINFAPTLYIWSVPMIVWGTLKNSTSLCWFTTRRSTFVNLYKVFFFVAQCSQGCINGICTSPGVCSCYSGWSGYSCEKGIIIHLWLYFIRKIHHSHKVSLKQLITNNWGYIFALKVTQLYDFTLNAHYWWLTKQQIKNMSTVLNTPFLYRYWWMW